jgi:hypothetical protein
MEKPQSTTALPEIWGVGGSVLFRLVPKNAVDAIRPRLVNSTCYTRSIRIE